MPMVGPVALHTQAPMAKKLVFDEHMNVLVVSIHRSRVISNVTEQEHRLGKWSINGRQITGIGHDFRYLE